MRNNCCSPPKATCTNWKAARSVPASRMQCCRSATTWERRGQHLKGVISKLRATCHSKHICCRMIWSNASNKEIAPLLLWVGRVYLVEQFLRRDLRGSGNLHRFLQHFTRFCHVIGFAIGVAEAVERRGVGGIVLAFQQGGASFQFRDRRRVLFPLHVGIAEGGMSNAR